MTLTPRLRQLLIGAGCALAFVVMASIFVPAHLRAGEGTGSQGGGVSLGRLENGRYVIEIFASPSGARYTVSTGGKVLGHMLTARQVAERFEGLPLPDVRADVPLSIHDGHPANGDR